MFDTLRHARDWHPELLRDACSATQGWENEAFCDNEPVDNVLDAETVLIGKIDVTRAVSAAAKSTRTTATPPATERRRTGETLTDRAVAADLLLEVWGGYQLTCCMEHSAREEPYHTGGNAVAAFKKFHPERGMLCLVCALSRRLPIRTVG